MSDLVIHARNLTKVYRLYGRPQHRFLDMFGLLSARSGAYTEHAALAGLDLDIRRGEKVGIIGRNGAGKSTLLKLVTQVIEPTSGTLEVLPGVHALLQLGTGFHPDFTGRQNALSYLSHLGLGPEEAGRKLIEVIDFAELEEYIDQPLKTYSTGMVARLMFAASTAVTPDILVIDEVLGVGDAYFAQKSFERIRELCSGSGTTLLLVSHDIYGTSRLCDRMIWIDRGKVVVDGASPLIVKAYEDSIREQEERRLRARRQSRLKEAQAPGSETESFVLEVRSRHNLPLPCALYISEISLRDHSGASYRIPLADPSAGEAARSRLDIGAGCWGEPEIHEGRTARAMRDHGSPFHKVSAVFSVPETSLEDFGAARIAIEYRSIRPCDVLLRGFWKERELDLGELPPSHGEWSRFEVELAPAAGRPAPSPDINLVGVHGSGAIIARNVRCMDHEGTESCRLEHGRPMSILFDYEIRREGLSEKAQCLLSFQRDGVLDVCRVITRALHFDSRKARSGTVSMRFPRLPLAGGSYCVSLMVAREDYYDSNPTLFYSINPDVYTCLNKVIELLVWGGGTVAAGTGVVAEAEWALIEPAAGGVHAGGAFDAT